MGNGLPILALRPSPRICMGADRVPTTTLAPIAVIAILAAAYVASPVLAPLALGLFIIALVWPLQAHLQSRMPKLLALAIVMLTIVATFLALASLVLWGFGRVGQALVSDAARFQLLYEQAQAWLEAHGIALAGAWGEHFNVRWLVRAVQEITGRVSTTLTFWLVVLLYVMLGLLEVDDFARKVRAMADGEAARVLLDGSAIAAAKLRKYMAVRTLMSTITGLLVCALAAIVGLPFAPSGAPSPSGSTIFPISDRSSPPRCPACTRWRSSRPGKPRWGCSWD